MNKLISLKQFITLLSRKKKIINRFLIILEVFIVICFLFYSFSFLKNKNVVGYQRSQDENTIASYTQTLENAPLTQLNSSVLGTSSFSFRSKTIPILMYHYIKEYNNKSDPIGVNLSVSPANFDRQMSEVVKSGYTPILFQDLLQYTQNGTSLPPKPIIISFDDGYDNHYSAALPILQKYNLKGSFAIITGFVGNQFYMSWDQIKSLKSAGNEIVSHTVSHFNLAKLNSQRLSFELAESKKTLDHMLNQDTKTLIYPSGQYNQSVIDTARQQGYLLARTTLPGSQVNSSNIMELPTVRMFNDTSLLAENYQKPNTPSNTKIIIDNTPPSGGITCPPITNSKNINITLTASDVDNPNTELKMQISNESTFKNINFENYSNIKIWNLGSEEGTKEIYVKFKDGKDNVSPVYSCNTILDTKVPELANITINASKTSIDMKWNLSKDAHSIIQYGVTEKYIKSLNAVYAKNSENIHIDTLIPCTNYHYSITTEDSAHNIVHSPDGQFLTQGCIGDSTIQIKNDKIVSSDSGGIVSLNHSDTTTIISPSSSPSNSTTPNIPNPDQSKLPTPAREISINVPPLFSKDKVASANFQIKKLEQSSAVNTIGTPKLLTSVGNHIYDIKAVTDTSTVIHDFNVGIDISIPYTKAEISNLDINKLRIYRYDNNEWYPLYACHNDTLDTQITCKTSNFSIFALFSEKQTVNNIKGNYLSLSISNHTVFTYILFSSILCSSFAYISYLRSKYIMKKSLIKKHKSADLNK